MFRTIHSKLVAYPGAHTIRHVITSILRTDFSMAKFIVCVDTVITSTDNRKFNDKKDRTFIPLCLKLSKHLKQ